MFAVKTWDELASYDDYKGAVTGVKFGASANFLVSILFFVAITFDIKVYPRTVNQTQ